MTKIKVVSIEFLLLVDIIDVNILGAVFLKLWPFYLQNK